MSTLLSSRVVEMTLQPRYVIIGTEGDQRVTAFQHALKKAGHATATVVDYVQFLNDGWSLDIDHSPSLLRFEAPGRHFEDFKAILAVGFTAARESGVESISPDRIDQLQPDKGLLIAPSQYFLGYQCVLKSMGEQLARFPLATMTNDVESILTAFDKRACHEMLVQHCVPLPRALRFGDQLSGYEELRSLMDEQRMPRVFIKLRYGSSAAGVVAYQVSGNDQFAQSTVQLARGDDGAVKLYNTRRICRYREHADIRCLIDALCKQGVHVESWIPKAGVEQRVCDLRIVTIAGEPRHMVLRKSVTPFTNLHLLNERSSVDSLVQQMDSDAWQSLLTTCRRVAACFPRMLHLGIDVAVKVGFRKHAVLEVNAFGDHLRGVTDQGMTTHEAEIAAVTQMAKGLAG